MLPGRVCLSCSINASTLRRFTAEFHNCGRYQDIPLAIQQVWITYDMGIYRQLLLFDYGHNVCGSKGVGS
jgi:hypothetical protein